MATALAAQLQALTKSTSGENRTSQRQKTRPSLLFDARLAADVDTATIFTFALSGLEELAKENPLFINFKNALFSIQSCQTDRELQDHEFNAKLNKSIHDFLYLISDFALLTTAHQTLEYLIRRYKVHVYNVDDLIKCTLPYHETSLFVRVLQLSDIERTRWQFLKGVIKSGAAPPRELLVQQCLHDSAILDGILETGHMLMIGDKPVSARTAYSFSVAIIIELLDTAKMVDSIVVKKILAFLVQCFDKGSSEEQKIGGLMIIGTLIKKVKLSDDVINLLFDLIIRAVGVLKGGALFEMAVMITIQLLETQLVSEIPEKVLRAIAVAGELSTVLSKFCGSFNSDYALRCLSDGLIKHCLSNNHYKPVLEELINAVPFRAIAQSTTLSLLGLITECLQSNDSLKRDMKANNLVMIVMSIREAFSDDVDFAINKFLKSHGGKMDSTVTFLNRTFKGTLSFILPDSNQTVHQSLQDSQAGVRVQALQQAAAAVKTNPEMTVICSEALLLGLHDVELSVVSSVLSVDGLQNLVNAEDLLISLMSTIERCVLLLHNASSSSREAVLVGKKCLNFITSVYVESHPHYAQRVGLTLLNNMLFTPKCWKLNLAAVKAAKNVDWIFFKGLPLLKDEIFSQSDKHKKESRKLWLFEVNTKVIEALASSMSENLESLATDLTTHIGDFERAKPLVALALLQCFKKVHQGVEWEAVNKYFGFLQQEWIAMETSKEFSLFQVNNKEMEMENIYTLEFFNMLYREPKVAFMSLLVAGFYKGLMCLPESDLGSCKMEYGQPLCRALERMFEIFSSPHSRAIFDQHSKLLLKKLPICSVAFLSYFFNAEGCSGEAIPVSAQINSLTVLLSQWNNSASLPRMEIQSALPHLVVALSSPLKAIRKGSLECLAKLLEMWPESFTLSNGSQMETEMLDSESFKPFLESIIAHRDCFMQDEEFICGFFTESLGFSDEKGQTESDQESRFKLTKPTQLSIFHFFVKNASLMPSHEQAKIFVILKGAVCVREQALRTKKVFEPLLKKWKLSNLDELKQESLSNYELRIFRHFLQIHLHHESLVSACKGKSNGYNAAFKIIMELLDIDEEKSLDNDTIETLCIVLLALEERVFQKFNEKAQDSVFKRLIEVSLSKQQKLQVGSRAALQMVNVNPAVIQRCINEILDDIDSVLKETTILNKEIIKAVKSITAILEFVLPLCDVDGMHVLVSPLFECLRMSVKLSANGKKLEINGENTDSHMQTEGINTTYIEQLVFEVLENVLTFKAGTMGETVKELYEVDYLVDFVHGTKSGATLNKALSLLATLGREFPDVMLKHVISLFSVIGETSMIQNDTQSFLVIERLLEAVIPNWLQSTKDPRLLLKIFVRALPDIPKHRRISLLKTTLRLMQESTSLHVLLLLLLENDSISSKTGEMLYKRGVTMLTDEKLLENNHWSEECTSSICEEYNVDICFPACLALLREWNQESLLHSWKLGNKIIMFISKQLQRAGCSTEAHSSSNEEAVKVALTDMLEVVLSMLQKLALESPNGRDSTQKAKNRVKKSAEFLLECITKLLSPASFAEAMVHLLRSEDGDLRTRALNLLTAKMNTTGLNDGDVEGSKQLYQKDVPSDTLSAYKKLVETIGILLDSSDHKLDRRAIVSALHSCSKRLAKRIPSVFVSSLQRLLSLLQEEYLPAILECISSIIVETRVDVLPMLHNIVKGVTVTLKQWHTVDVRNGRSSFGYLKEADINMGILSVLEALIVQLDGFLYPHLDDILQLLLLEPGFFSNANKKINERAQSVRNLLAKSIPVRLLLGPLIAVYERSLEMGEASVLVCVDMLTLVVTSFEKPSVQAHSKTVFELCLRSFDLRRKPPDSMTSITRVETAIISLFSALVLKLSESTFKPLFVRLLEWAESAAPNEVDGTGVVRFIVFYKIVNQLAVRLRSVFVPYFQYFFKRCTQQLMDGQHVDKPKKKLKFSNQLSNENQRTSCLSSEEWHLRFLIVCSLQKCFLYDTIGFLDTEKFQALLEPLVGQIYVNKPALTEGDSVERIPSTQDMDSALVECLGQMAITAGTDLLWKPLNHKVLLCTRNDAVRIKIVSLDIVRFMVDNLREDYLALLPETIPFLAELLEDHEQLVISKSQQIIKLLENLSGESLSQYL